MMTFYNIRIDGSIKWIFKDEQKALERYYRLQEEKPTESVLIERSDTDNAGIVERQYIYIAEYDAWLEKRKGGAGNGGILHGKKKFTTRRNVWGK